MAFAVHSDWVTADNRLAAYPHCLASWPVTGQHKRSHKSRKVIGSCSPGALFKLPWYQRDHAAWVAYLCQCSTLLTFLKREKGKGVTIAA